MTNAKLVEHCKMALREQWGYVYGTFGNVLTSTVLQNQIRQYPSNVTRFKSYIEANWLGKRSADCVGLIKSYLWWNGGKVKYNSSQDRNANGMYSLSKKKGPLNTIPEIPGILVWKNNHIGVYIGNGRVIESRGTKEGVINSPLKGSGSANWTNWCESPYIKYQDGLVPSKEKMPPNRVSIDLLGKKVVVTGYLKDGVNYVLIGDSYIPVRKIFESMGLKVAWNNGVVVSE